MEKTVTHSNVNIGGDPNGHRLLTSKTPFAVNGVAAVRLAETIYAYRLLENEKIVTITEVSEPQ